MSKILEKNLDALRKKWPKLTNLLNQPLETDDWKITTAKNGTPSLLIKTKTGEMPLHSQFNPQREAMRWAEDLGDEWEKLILFGMGLGYHLVALKKLYPNKKVLLVENSLAHFYQGIRVLDFVEVFDWLEDILIIEDAKYTGQWLASYIIENSADKGLLIKALSVYERVYQEYWQSLQQHISDTILIHRGNIATTLHFRAQWLVNFKNNLLTYLETPSLEHLFGKFTNLPVIVVAAGPSLEKNVHLLPQLKNKAVILAAGSAIGPLLYHGISPDIVLSIDPSINNYKHFENITENHIPLAFTSTLHHQIVESYKGPKLSFSSDYYSPLDRSFEVATNKKRAVLPSGATVAIPTIFLAKELGGNPIILLGQDLAYAFGKTHAKGNIGRASSTEVDRKPVKLEDIYGKQVDSNEMFKAFKIQIEEMLRGFPDAIQLIDATEGGAKIEGTEIMTLQEVIDKYCQNTYPITAIINEALAKEEPLTKEEQEKLADKVEKLLKNADKMLKEEKLFQEEIKKLSNRLEKNDLKPQDLTKRYKQIKKNHHQIQKTELYKNYIQMMSQELFDIKMIFMTNQIEKAEELEEQTKIIINGYQDIFEIIKDDTEFLKTEIFEPLLTEIKALDL